MSGKEFKVSNTKNEEKRVAVVGETDPTQDQLPSQPWGNWEGTLESRTPPTEESLLGKPKFVKTREPNPSKLVKSYPDQTQSPVVMCPKVSKESTCYLLYIHEKQKNESQTWWCWHHPSTRHADAGEQEFKASLVYIKGLMPAK